MKRHGLAALLFILGCATGGVASQLVVPPVRAGTNPTRWEFFCTALPADHVNDTLRRTGAEGWEMVSTSVAHYSHEWGNDYAASSYTFCYKRALP